MPAISFVIHASWYLVITYILFVVQGPPPLLSDLDDESLKGWHAVLC